MDTRSIRTWAGGGRSQVCAGNEDDQTRFRAGPKSLLRQHYITLRRCRRLTGRGRQSPVGVQYRTSLSHRSGCVEEYCKLPGAGKGTRKQRLGVGRAKGLGQTRFVMGGRVLVGLRFDGTVRRGRK